MNTVRRILYGKERQLNFATVNLYTSLLKGPDEDVPRSMDCIEFVCRAPSELFKEFECHPPFVVRRKPNLEELAQAADQILDCD